MKKPLYTQVAALTTSYSQIYNLATMISLATLTLSLTPQISYLTTKLLLHDTFQLTHHLSPDQLTQPSWCNRIPGSIPVENYPPI